MGLFYQEKSGNPDSEREKNVPRGFFLPRMKKGERA
jgi:hypothetical protein